MQVLQRQRRNGRTPEPEPMEVDASTTPLRSGSEEGEIEED